MQKILENIEDCTGCSSCAQSCAIKCIAMTPDEEGFLFPRIDPSKCTDCGLCQRVCPVIRAKSEAAGRSAESSSQAKPPVYAAWVLDEAVRINSSSGGVFSALADTCIKQGGVVFGASFDGDFKVVHVGITNSAELDGLRRSKYVQSDIQTTYAEAEKYLKDGRPVLFAGTGCQIAGLKSYLMKDYPGLLALDLVCYGVPSPGIWSLYVNYMKERYRSDIKSASFRNKQRGWKRYRMRIEFANGRVYSRPAIDEPFFIGFGKGLFNRKCWSSCMFRHPNSKADITLADFWGVDKLPGSGAMDNKGVSQLIINTDKGRDALDQITGGCHIQERAFEEAAKGNPRLVSSSPISGTRALFYRDFAAGMPFSGLKRKYMNPAVQRAKRFVKFILRKK